MQQTNVSLCGAICAVLFALLPVAAGASDPPPLSAFGALPEVESVALSASGDRIGAVMTVHGQRELLILTSGLDQLQSMPLGNEKIRSLGWAGDKRLIVVLSQTNSLGVDYTADKFEFVHAVIVPVDDSSGRWIVFDKDPAMMNAVFGTFGARQVGGEWKAFFGGVQRQRGARDYYLQTTAPALFTVDLDKPGWKRLAEHGAEGESRTWLIGADGTVAATLSMQTVNGNWSIMAPGGILLAHGVSKRGNVGLVSLGKNLDTLIYREENESDGNQRMFEVPLNGQGLPVPFAQAADVRQLFNDPATGKLLGYTAAGENQRPKFFAPDQQKDVDAIFAAFPNLDVSLVGWTPDFAHVLVRTSGNGDSGTWYLVDSIKKTANAIGYERIAIDPEHVGPISRVRYKAQDGLDLDGILTLPPGREAKNLPVVLLPHGGPHAQDDAVFDWWAQAIASRGYAVFQPNFRGSTNHGEAFERAGFGQWGKAMQTDISDGLAELAKKGIVNPKRACIVGASYGGYAALAGVTLQQGIYRCAVAVAGVSDLSKLFLGQMKDSGQSGMLKRSLLEELGPSSGFDAISPRRFASRADAPILMIHGRDDTVVPYEQTQTMADALKAAGKPYKVVDLASEDHWLSRSETRQQMLTEAVAWIEKYNPPD